MAITSAPSPGVPAQTFETVTPASFSGPSDIPVTLVPPGGMTAGSVLLAGTVTGISTGDSLLLVPQGWDGRTQTWAVITVQSTAPAADPSGGMNTLVSFEVSAGTDPAEQPGAPPAASYRLLRPISSTPLMQPVTEAEVSQLSFDLAATVRGITPGNIVMIDGSGSYPAVVTGYSEATWYSVNGDPATPAFPAPDAAGTTPPVVVPYPHSVLQLAMPPSAASALSNRLASFQAWVTAQEQLAAQEQVASTEPVAVGEQVTSTEPTEADFQARAGAGWAPRRLMPPQILRYAFTDTGTLIPVPVTALVSLPAAAAVPDGFAPPAAAFVEDSTGAGAAVTVTAAGPGQVTLGAPAGGGTALSPALVPPLRLLANLVEVTRGASVTGEILGSGDASTGGQVFTLAKSPLTYLAAGSGQASTLTVSVSGVAWTEVSTLFGQSRGAPVFVTRQLPDGSTQVRFGDGVNGARLPSGTGNVVASYRYGSGAASPPAGTLTSVARPQPGLAGVRNPVPVAGGADPDLPSALRRNAPASTLTLGRAISRGRLRGDRGTDPGGKPGQGRLVVQPGRAAAGDHRLRGRYPGCRGPGPDRAGRLRRPQPPGGRDRGQPHPAAARLHAGGVRRPGARDRGGGRHGRAARSGHRPVQPGRDGHRPGAVPEPAGRGAERSRGAGRHWPAGDRTGRSRPAAERAAGRHPAARARRFRPAPGHP